MRFTALVSAFVVAVSAAACGGSPPPAATTPDPSAADSTAAAPKVLVNVDAEGVGVTGYDPVSYATAGKPVPGDQEYAATHDSAIYWFSTPASKAAFEAAPAKHAPQYGGYCAWAASEGRLSEVQAEVFEIVDGQLLLFTNPEFKRLFDQDPAGAKKKADAEWPKLVAKYGKPAANR